MKEGNSFRIVEDDVRFIVYLWVNVGLELLGDRSNGLRRFAGHEPGHEIRAVTAEIVQRAGAVQLGIGEPRKELGFDMD